VHWDLGSVAPLLRLAPERRLRVRLRELLLATRRSLPATAKTPASLTSRYSAGVSRHDREIVPLTAAVGFPTPPEIPFHDVQNYYSADRPASVDMCELKLDLAISA
jgi:hypothetical protein